MKNWRRQLFAPVLVLVGLTACRNDEAEPEAPEPAAGMPFTSFSAGRAGETVSLESDAVIIYNPNKTDYSAAIVRFETEPDAVVTCDGDTLRSGDTLDLSYPRTLLTYTSGHPEGVTTRAQASCRARIPIVYITVSDLNTLNNSQEYQSLTITLDANGSVENCPRRQYTGKIRGRGNSTFWNMPKKPYRIHLNDKAGVFGMDSHKDWTLLANYADKTLMRTKLAFDMGRAMGLPYTPDYRFAEVYVNSVYQGVYQIADQVEIASGRVEGRYLLEINNRAPSFRGGVTNYPFELEYPSDYTDEELSEIRTFITTAEKALLSSSRYTDREQGFRKYWDVDTGIKWAIVNELFKNSDAKDYASIFMYQKTRGGKIYWGPLWDFDLGAANYGWTNHGDCTQNNTEGWWIFENRYFSRMYTDSGYKARVKEIWAEYKDRILALIQSIPDIREELALPTEYNNRKWPTMKDYADYSNYNLPDTYEEQVEFLQEWLEERYQWLDRQW